MKIRNEKVEVKNERTEIKKRGQRNVKKKEVTKVKHPSSTRRLFVSVMQ